MIRMIELQCGPIGCGSASPNARPLDFGGLVKLVDRGVIESHDWRLTPGRHVSVAPEEGEDFDFEKEVRSIHIDLKGLNEEAAVVAAQIERNFMELSI